MTGAEEPATDTGKEANNATEPVSIAIQFFGLLILGGMAGAAAWTGHPPDRWLVLVVAGITAGVRPETLVQAFKKGPWR